MAKGLVISVFLLALIEVTSALTISSESQMLTMIKEIQGKTYTQEKAMRTLQSHIAKQDIIINSLQSHIAEQGHEISSLQSHIAEQGHEISSLQSHIAEQGHEISSLQSQIAEQGHEISSLQSHIAEQGHEISSLQSHIAEQGHEISSLQSHIAEQGHEISSLQSHIAEQGHEISSLKDQEKRQNNLINAFLEQWKLHSQPISDWSEINMEHNNAIQANKVQPYPNDTLRDQEQTPFKQEPKIPKRLSTESAEPVAFQAVISAHTVSHIGLHQKIVFDSVHLNIGGSYLDLIGVFIAPRGGIYLFATSILTDPRYGIEVAIMKNGISLGGAICGSDDYDQGSYTVVVQLYTADEVWVEAIWPADARLRGGFYTSFTGVLVMGM